MGVYHEYAEYYLTVDGWTSSTYHRGETEYTLPTGCLRAFQTMTEEGSHPTPGIWTTEIYRSDDVEELRKAMQQHGEVPAQIKGLVDRGIYTPPSI